MKLFLSILFFSVFFSLESEASPLIVKNKIDIKMGEKQQPLNDIYYFLLMGDGCFHLVHLNPPGYTSSDGQYFAGWSVTTVNSLSYEGTVMICPTDGTAYC